MNVSIPDAVYICPCCEQELARARSKTRRAISGLIIGPGLAAASILALPYLFRAVFFLERVLGAQP